MMLLIQIARSDKDATDLLVHALTKFVSIPSVSNYPSHREDCRQAAIWLRKCLTQLGAEASLVSRIGHVPRPIIDNTRSGSYQQEILRTLSSWLLSAGRRHPRPSLVSSSMGIMM